MGIDRGRRSETARREALANAGQRARERTAAGYEVRNSNYRPRATTVERAAAEDGAGCRSCWPSR